jgi:hypothetical protein
MLVLDKLIIENPSVLESETCVYEHSTVICGKIIEVDYLSRVEDKMVYESFYGDIDLFGF